MEDTARDLVVSTVAEHADSLLRVARRYTDCAADAEDAYQRTMEIFVRNAGRLDAESAHRWVHTVCKHEAMEVRRQRARLVGVAEESALDALDDGRHLASVEERSERFDELTRAAEALRRLKPQEVTALLLKAQGLSYNEIAERENWTYTKVNRCLTEGRRAFLARVAGIESGEECERWAPVLSAMADGEARARDVLAVRPHLRNCAGCRTTLAEMRRAPAAAAALLPVPVVAAGLLSKLAAAAVSAQERLVAPLVKAQSALEATGASKLAAVAASTAAIAGGGVAVQQSTAGEPAPRSQRTAATAPEKPEAAVPPPAAAAPSPPAEERSPGTRSPSTPEPAPAGDEFAVEPPAVTATTSPKEPEPAPPAADEFGFEPGS